MVSATAVKEVSATNGHTNGHAKDGINNGPPLKKAKLGDNLMATGRIYDYTSSANPDMPEMPVLVHPPSLHQTGESRVIPFDLSKQLGTAYAATSPNLMASYIRIKDNESVKSDAHATSQAFYIIRGEGCTKSEFGSIQWSQGDLFVIPMSTKEAEHHATQDAAIYWVSDEPLMNYLGVSPSAKKFEPTVFRREALLAEVEKISHAPGAEHLNRVGVLLGNQATESTTKTLSHVLWSLLNLLPAGNHQRPHRHNSVALDLCVGRVGDGDGKVYTLLGPELDENGWVKDPIKVEWLTGGVFTTPPGWWHSHHNETDEPAWVLPLQDAGLYTYQTTLDIRFAPPVREGEPAAPPQSSMSKA
jgi:gentisate 1,2-dioxygenase|eukprot:CAMPEP_0174292834 /NCGR_PEP_ID=MMETSP0809-20121228/36639_1 /TAXON_ID=73025 ORGANISM="Eutreptiella gymnastica-like, Strain CCMP1594" /NCGR_SAMPLE_ID=MMETSP0809 /ASSEMBLY_ACC=CAM_ASM_000658 /LENGTH=358 /DNA_ID=CAMNT_0015393155 /DNA_START=34 /DNA_END=1110 /DNA_ORIENTATION=+